MAEQYRTPRLDHALPLECQTCHGLVPAGETDSHDSWHLRLRIAAGQPVPAAPEAIRDATRASGRI